MSNLEPATILLIDDHPMLRTGVKQLVSMASDITVVGEASNGEQGIELAESLDPDLILLDLNMPGMNGLETLDKLREKSLSGRIVVFSVSNHEEDVVTALKRGGLAPIFPYTFYHLTHYWFAAADIPVANDTPVHYADAIRCNVRRPPQGSLPLLTRRVSA